MKYTVIYLDPPWKYNSRANHKTRFRGGAEGHYPLMTMPEIAALPIPELQITDEAKKALNQDIADLVLSDKIDIVVESNKTKLVADAKATAELIRTRLLAIPPRAAPLCAAVALGPRQVAEVEAVLADEVNAALEALQAARFA